MTKIIKFDVSNASSPSVCPPRFPLVSSSPVWRWEPQPADCWVSAWSSWPTTTATGSSLKGGARPEPIASLRGSTLWSELPHVQVRRVQIRHPNQPKMGCLASPLVSGCRRGEGRLDYSALFASTAIQFQISGVKWMD